MDDSDFESMSFDSSEEQALLIAAIREEEQEAVDEEHEELQRRSRSCRVREWVTKSGQMISSLLTQEISTQDQTSFKDFLQMDEESFEILVHLVESDLVKADTNMRKSIPVRDKLSATLRFLATGESYTSLSHHTNISLSFLSGHIPTICSALYENLLPLYMKFPETVAEWEQIAELFETRCGFPLCIGALDGKHVAFKANRDDGNFYKNCEGLDSIVLLALVDTNCKFICIDVGCNGRINDEGVLRRSDLMTFLENANRYLPKSRALGNGRTLPYVIVADDAFPLQEHIMKPFSCETQDPKEKYFNRRISRARKCVESTFDMLSSKFKVLQTNIYLRPEKVVQIVQACCVLHNFLQSRDPGYQDRLVELSDSVQMDQNPIESARHTDKGVIVRNMFAEHFFNEIT